LSISINQVQIRSSQKKIEWIGQKDDYFSQANEFFFHDQQRVPESLDMLPLLLPVVCSHLLLPCTSHRIFWLMIPPGAANYFRVCSKESHGIQCQEQGGKVELQLKSNSLHTGCQFANGRLNQLAQVCIPSKDTPSKANPHI